MGAPPGPFVAGGSPRAAGRRESERPGAGHRPRLRPLRRPARCTPRRPTQPPGRPLVAAAARGRLRHPDDARHGRSPVLQRVRQRGAVDEIPPLPPAARAAAGGGSFVSRPARTVARVQSLTADPSSLPALWSTTASTGGRRSATMHLRKARHCWLAWEAVVMGLSRLGALPFVL